MYSTNSKIGKQVLVWALMFTLVLSAIPTAISDESDDEWFWDIDEIVSDEDQDGADDTIEIGYDPDTTCDCDIDITVYIDIYDEDGYVGYIYEDYTINNGEGDWFEQEWTPDYNGTFDFYVEMYDEWGNSEDNWSVTDVELSPMTGSPPASDDTINVDNYVGADDEDGVNNDIVLFAHNEDEGIDEVEISVEYFNGLTWAYYANGTTNNDGDYIVYNASSGEYRWTASYNGTDLEEETVSYTEVDTVNNLSHQMGVEDWDGAGDYDDFFGVIFEDDDTKDDGYVEVYDKDGELYDSGNTDHDYYGYDIYLLDDVEKGNYTFNLYYEENGELLQSGWLHSFGSTSTNYDEWFEDWEYETEDTNGDGVANSIITKYDPNTECNCTIDIEVDFSAYNNDTGDYDSGNYYNHEINGTEVDSFETDEWSPSKNGNYTFEFSLYDENWNYEDHFNFTVYLECDEDSNDSDCDNDEWFEDWDYETEDNDEDNLDDTIDISYNPDTDCDCEIEVEVDISVYENSTGDWVDSEYDYHIINGTEEEYFEQSWNSHESQSYDFYVYLYDDEWNNEDSFWIYNVYLYQTSGAGGPGDEDEWFDWIDAYTYDDDDDGYDDTAEIEYDPDTTCDCDINITLVIDVYDNETGSWVNGTEEDYTIYSDDDDYWYQDWSPEYNGTFDFYVELYDEDGNLEDEEEYLNISLHARSSGGDEDYDEYFYSWDYDVYPSDKITIGYDPDTECDCEMEIYVYVDVYENETGEYVDYVYANHTIYNGEGDYFTQDWTSWNDDYYDFDVYMYDEDYNFEDEFWIYDVYLSSDDGGGGNGTGDDNGVGHVGMIDDWDEDDYVNDYIGGVLENDEFKEDAYFEIYDEDDNLVDSGNPNYYGILFVSSNLTEGWYYQDIYYEEDDALLQTGPFYSYGNSTEFEVVNVDNLVVDDDEYAVYDDVGFIAHQGNTSEENGVADVGIEISKYNHSTEEWDYHAYVETNETGEAWLYNETCGEYEWYASTEDEKGYYEVWAHCDDDGNGGGGDEDYDEWFYDWDYDVDPSDTIHIGYDPDTECDCDVDIVVYIDVFDNDTGDYIDNIYDEHTIYNGEGDYFTQDWTAYYDATYDFNVYMYDPEYEHVEDEFWIYDVYLSSDGGGGNQTGDDNGVGHAGFIDDWEEDGNVNDYIGFVLIDDYFKEDAYFEIYQDGVLVDSGHAVNEIFVSDNLPEGWYEHVVYYEEDGPVLQDGPFYSYGNSSNPETSDIVNVDNAVVDDDEYAVYDDVGFLAHRGNTSEENGEEGVEIAVYVWNEDEESWYDHAYLVTNETGEAWLYNETCGQYEWESYNVEEKGYYEVWAGCDDGSGGGDNETKDYDEWFSYWDYWGKYDENDEHEWNKLNIGYDPDTECDCDVDIEVYIDVVDNETGDYIGSLYYEHTIYNGEGDWFELEWTADYAGKYDFYVELYDQEYGHPEDSFMFSLIMSDEWFDDNWFDEDNMVYVDLDPQTNYDGEIETSYDFEVYRFNEDNDDWEWFDSNYADALISGSDDNEDIHFEWTADEGGNYRFVVYMYDEYWNMEDWADFEVEIILNSAPVIHGINRETVFEGQLFNFEVDVTDEDGDDLEFSWDMGDGTLGGGPWGLHDETIPYVYQDDGEYVITVAVSDGNGGRTEAEFTITVENLAPTLELSYDNFGQEGQTLDFNSQAYDVAEDTVTVTWSFPDGTQIDGNFAQYTFIDDGQFTIRVSATDEDGGEVTQDIVVTIENVAPIFTEFVMPSSAKEGETLEFIIDAMDPGDDIIIFNIDFGDGTSPLITQDGRNISHRFAEGDTFTLIICAKDEDGGETCRSEVLPVSLLEQLEDEGLLPGFNLLTAISALGIIGILRRRTH